MVKRIRDYVKYTLSELEKYVATEGSCISKVNAPIHIQLPPHGLTNFRESLLQIIAQRKIGFFDAKLEGIILDVKNIKVLGDLGKLRFDDPAIHLNLVADCYIFKAQIGAVIKGTVKHISPRQIGVIIYRVFSVTIRLKESIDEDDIELNSEIEFRIKNFDLQNVMPFIEGELVIQAQSNDNFRIPEQPNNPVRRNIVFAESSSEDSDSSDSSVEKKPSIKTEIEIENDIIIQTTVNGVKKDKDSDMDIEESVIVQEFTNLKRIEPEPNTQKQQTNRKRLSSDSSLFSIASTVNERPDFDKVKSLPVEKISGKRKRSSSSEIENSQSSSKTVSSKRQKKTDYVQRSINDIIMKLEAESADETLNSTPSNGKKSKSEKKTKQNESINDIIGKLKNNNFTSSTPIQTNEETPTKEKTKKSKRKTHENIELNNSIEHILNKLKTEKENDDSSKIVEDSSSIETNSKGNTQKSKTKLNNKLLEITSKLIHDRENSITDNNHQEITKITESITAEVTTKSKKTKKSNLFNDSISNILNGISSNEIILTNIKSEKDILSQPDSETTSQKKIKKSKSNLNDSMSQILSKLSFAKDLIDPVKDRTRKSSITEESIKIEQPETPKKNEKKQEMNN